MGRMEVGIPFYFGLDVHVLVIKRLVTVAVSEPRKYIQVITNYNIIMILIKHKNEMYIQH